MVGLVVSNAKSIWNLVEFFGINIGRTGIKFDFGLAPAQSRIERRRDE